MQTKSFSQPSTTESRFARGQKVDIQRSSFKRDCGVKTTINAGDLVPVWWDEVLPGDTVNLSANILARLATPIYPVMDNIFIDVHWFFVPERLVWDNWQKMMGEQVDPTDSIDYIMPVVNMAKKDWAPMTLVDYLGIPDIQSNRGGVQVRAGPFRAYNLIYNEWYRDQNLQESVEVYKGDAVKPSTDYFVLKRGKRHDYFTSALPFTQKGDAVSLSLSGDAPVYTKDRTAGTVTVKDNDGVNQLLLSNNITRVIQLGGSSSISTGGLTADISSVSAFTINELIEAFAVQDLLVRDARGGTRYAELIQVHFGVVSPDARLQRPEYLGGSSRSLDFYSVPQTSESGATPQGNLSAYSIGENQSGFTKSFVEHGMIFCLVSMRADLNYQQGLLRKWSRSTRYDFYFPSFAHLGEQAILNKELYLQGDNIGPNQDDLVFGYQEAWSEYRYNPNLITGLFRSDAPQSLDAWHLAQDFGSLPVLGSSFIQENPPMERILAVTDEADLIFDMHIAQTWARPMPTRSIPSLRNHF